MIDPARIEPGFFVSLGGVAKIEILDHSSGKKGRVVDVRHEPFGVGMVCVTSKRFVEELARARKAIFGVDCVPSSKFRVDAHEDLIDVLTIDPTKRARIILGEMLPPVEGTAGTYFGIDQLLPIEGSDSRRRTNEIIKLYLEPEAFSHPIPLEMMERRAIMAQVQYLGEALTFFERFPKKIEPLKMASPA